MNGWVQNAERVLDLFRLDRCLPRFYMYPHFGVVGRHIDVDWYSQLPSCACQVFASKLLPNSPASVVPAAAAHCRWDSVSVTYPMQLPSFIVPTSRSLLREDHAVSRISNLSRRAAVPPSKQPVPTFQMGLEKAAPSASTEPVQESAPNMWIVEQITPYDAYHHGVKQLLLSKNTKFQAMTIADTGAYGRALFLDGSIQTTEGDEPFYHEPLVHLPCLVHSSPENVLILGGADGGAAREALRWHSVKSVVVVDIDGEVVDACRKYLPNIAQGSLDDPRCELIVGDALDYINRNQTSFDVIICDLTDPEEDGPSLRLFNREFFSKLKQTLTPMGVLSLMGGPASLRESKTLFPRMCATLSSVFKSVRPSQVFVPTYGAPLGIVIATGNTQPLPEAGELDLRIENSVKGEMHVLDGASVHGHFAIPRCLRKALREETEIITVHNQAHTFGKGILNNKG